jgi:hypothetical protein
MRLTALLPQGEIYPSDGDGRGFGRSPAWTSAVTPIYWAGVLRGSGPRLWYDRE